MHTSKRVFIIFCGLLLLANLFFNPFMIHTVLAQSIEDQRDEWNEMIGKQDIPPFFDPYTSLLTCSTLGPVTLSGSTNFEKIVSYFAGKGLSDIAIAGILANLQHESGLSPFRVQNQTRHSQDHKVPAAGLGYGLAQFTPSTKIKPYLMETEYGEYFSTKYGGPISLWNEGGDSVPEGVPPEVNDTYMGIQLNYFYNGEMQTTKVGPYRNLGGVMGLDYIGDKETILSALMAAKNEKDAARIFLWIYERPADKPGAAIDREKWATDMLPTVQALLNGSADGTTTPLTSANQCSDQLGAGSESDFIKTVKEFAWEDGRRNNTQPKDEYLKAIVGRYRGGDHLGRDCGAFVSALMVKSGFEPSYPGAPSASQEKWLESNDGWEKIATRDNVDTATLRPGDIAVIGGSHVFVWTGEIEGFAGQSAEAALASKTAPTAIKDNNTFSAPSKYTWFRKKG